MEVDFHALAKECIRNLTPYQPGKPIEELERELGITSSIKLASNENPLGPSPKAIKAIQEFLPKAHIYPDGSYYEIKRALSNFLSVKPNQITMGNGSENVLELIIKAYLQKGDEAILSQYAFLTIPILLQGYGVTLQTIPAKNWGHDLVAMGNAINKNTRIVFLVNPNNPTGTYNTDNEFKVFLKKIPPNVLIVVDEAYVEYISQKDYPDTLSYLINYPNLIITRTFSKVYGLAALRIGYAISSPIIADILNRARLPFNVNSLAAKAAIFALQDIEHLKQSIELNNNGMKQLEEGLTNLTIPYIPSLGNFITLNVGDAKDIYQKLLHQGVIVRPLAAYDMPQYIRVTIGTKTENKRFLESLEKVLS